MQDEKMSKRCAALNRARDATMKALEVPYEEPGEDTTAYWQESQIAAILSIATNAISSIRSGANNALEKQRITRIYDALDEAHGFASFHNLFSAKDGPLRPVDHS